jgi:hypothetical protein
METIIMIIGESLENNTMLPNFTRDIYDTLENMKSVSKKRMPQMYIALCSETGKAYLYNKSNEADETLGLWRELDVSGGSSAASEVPEEETDTIDFSTWPEFTNPEANGIVLDGQGGANVDGSNVSVDPDDIEPDD